MCTVLDRAWITCLGIQRMVSIVRCAQQDLPSWLEHCGQRFHQALVVADMLDRLQADDLIERTKFVAVILDRAQVDDATVDAGNPEHPRACTRALLLT